MCYDPKSSQAVDFIHHATIVEAQQRGVHLSKDRGFVRSLLQKAKSCVGLNHEEVATLIALEDPELLQELYNVAREIKDKIYGKRIVIFAPLYLSDYCVNNCLYCGYKVTNGGSRRRLSQEEIRQEVTALQKMGHKRLVLEVGEDPVHCPIEYILESIGTIYNTKVANGAIRRVNINIAATTVENYRKLKEAEVGTYILFQETYHKPSYEHYHPSGPKSDYAWHTEAMDRAMEGGLDDVGIGALYGLYDSSYEAIATLMHAKHLEDRMGVGPHTISVPRIKPAEGVAVAPPMQPVSDKDFKRLVAVLRCAVPYTGIILSTREEEKFREEVMALGVSQISAGSCTGVGGYTLETKQPPQFEVSDDRQMDEILFSLCKSGYIPSFCTACYREGRTGDRFMQLAKSGQICNVCQPNALLTLEEYLQDYASPETAELGTALIGEELSAIKNSKAKEKTTEYLEKIRRGERDFRF